MAVTPINAPTEYYNVTLKVFTNDSEVNNYYNYSYTLENAFYLNAYRNLNNVTVNPSSAYYTYKNWNFSVQAISGNATPMDIKIYLKSPGGSFQECSPSLCVNQTPTRCTQCTNDTFYWYNASIL